MLLSVTGASGVGKSTALAALTREFGGDLVVCVEFDSIGVPVGADTAWRHGALEQWVQRAIQEQGKGRDFLLCGQVPVGELLAVPSADRLDGIAACLLHCSPEVRRQRLIDRSEDLDMLADHLAFGEWFYWHMTDPTHVPEVIKVPSPVAMRWGRWDGWSAGDPRWSFEVINTNALTREEVGNRVVEWAREALAGRGASIRIGN